MATTIDNLQTLAAAWQCGVEFQPIIVDLLKYSNLLQTAAVGKASHGIKHRYRYFNSLPTAAFRDIGDGIVPQKVDVNTAQIDLKELGFDLYDDYRAILEYPGGKDAWLADNAPAAYAGISNAISRAVFYGNITTFGYAKAFKGLHQYAKDLSQVIAQKGGSTGYRTSAFAVRWDDFDGASIKINNTAPVNVLDITPSQPVPIVLSTSTNEQLNVYKWIIASYMTLIVPSKKSVAVITQIDATHAPTADNMNALVDAVRAPNGRVAIYTSNLGARQIATLKDGKLSAYMTDNNYDNSVGSWRNVPIFVDENISEAETTGLD